MSAADVWFYAWVLGGEGLPPLRVLHDSPTEPPDLPPGYTEARRIGSLTPSPSQSQ